MKFLSPKAADIFKITAAAVWPSIVFTTDATGAHVWHWSIAWDTYKQSGIANTVDNTWDAQSVVDGLGGTLTVNAQAKDAKNVPVSVSINVKIKGDNPLPMDVDTYLSTKPESAGFEKIVQKESQYKHFNHSGEPIKSFDAGYGLCQLTTPKPSFAQVWSWKRNIDGGLGLYAQKRNSAITYLSQSSRTYTGDQLKYEAVCRWNGGSYHVWDAKGLKWVRPSSILCDTRTGNIGWDMNDAENAGKTEADLRKRDSGSYSSAPAAGAHWRYSGVCYADRMLG
ncbi:MAG: hypothetical protein M3Y64_02420 [Gemmatimonadota bacterium]|nr:hypothetical protein [Gemmatimonadota bacterium]